MRLFGKKEMGKRYAINAINATITKYDYETVLMALELIPASTISLYKMSECHEKESCLVAELVSFIEELRKRQACSCKSVNLLICGILRSDRSYTESFNIVEFTAEKHRCADCLSIFLYGGEVMYFHFFQYFIGFKPIVCVGSVARNVLKQNNMGKKVKAVIDGTVKEIIIGRSPYNMERPKDKSDLLSAIDRKNQLRLYIADYCVVALKV